MSLLTELKQRTVLRVAATYAAIAWLLIQISATGGPALNLPEWTSTFVTVLLILGFPAAVVLAWTYDVVRTDKSVPSEVSGIAVLPFANLTGETEQGHLADGIVEDLLTRLQASDRIRVVSRQSSRSYKDRAADARTSGCGRRGRWDDGSRAAPTTSRATCTCSPTRRRRPTGPPQTGSAACGRRRLGLRTRNCV
jgi:hypothetical protein